jgi:nitrile hydratase
MTESAPSRFKMGDTVRVRRQALPGNPRTPSYARGKVGIVTTVHGCMPNPLDHRGVYPPLYTIVFPISDVFPGRGEGALHADIHEDWLEPA